MLAVLAAAVVVTGLGGLWLGGWAWGVFVFAYVALVAYLALLVQLRSRRDEARSKVRHLRAPAPVSSGVRVHRAHGA